MAGGFEQEVERLRELGVPGPSGRLREMFDYLAERGEAADPATQSEIALHVFGQAETDSDDATVRVYIHRLRKRLEDFYARGDGAGGEVQLEIPPGTYALRAMPGDGTAESSSAGGTPSLPRFRWPIVLVATLALLLAFVAGAWLVRPEDRVNAIWQPVVESERPVLVVLGDYYMFGEIDPVRPEQGRLIRDFRVDSPEDLRDLQEAEPERYGFAEDFGLTYLPVASANALRSVIPLLSADGREVEVIPSSSFSSDMLTRYDIVYLGLFSGLGLLEEPVFAGSGFSIGETYDEVIDRYNDRRYVSEEARSLASPAYYRDFAWITRLRGPAGGWIVVLAGSRDTGLRAIGPLATRDGADGKMDEIASTRDNFEALFQVTGQQGTDLAEKLLVARPRN